MKGLGHRASAFGRALPPFAASLAVLVLIGSGAARAADHVPPPPQRLPLLVTNAVLHPVSGPVIEGGRMLVERGRIVALAGPGQPLPAPSSPPQVLDLGGRHVYPGFVAANTALGLAEVSSVAATVDLREVGPLNPNARALVAVNPDSELLPVARSNGVLAALAVPEGAAGGGFSGTSALLQMDGWTWDDMAVQREVAVHLELPSLRLGSEVLRGALEPLAEELRRFTAQRLKLIDEAFESAAAYGRARGADPAHPADLRWEALLPVLRGERPLFVQANELAQIRHALALAERHGFKLVIVGGADAWRIASVLRQRQVAVVIAGVHRLPLRRDEAYDEPYRLAARLAEAGVTYCIGRTGGAFAAANERNLPYEAGTAVAHGLAPDEALKAITLYPAQILGVADRLGSLAPGRLASFIVTDGDPLQTETQVLRAFIQGREVEIGNRQTRLADKYRQKYEQLKSR
ncbi:Amidohydro-rel domain-containing protein [Rubrivivax sp. A210]|uniref:amidohydrolase family protein n=1 Tax=Rubrivivax sp. A210 TaxID=2772301 RepID=UPI001919F6C1|nr:amidohydrolase family protein [Rubrivivax sp. A210]CAD5367172.1 Amidohydro-rel domain-containing protein [Rubrivivax sp. A210]